MMLRRTMGAVGCAALLLASGAALAQNGGAGQAGQAGRGFGGGQGRGRGFGRGGFQMTVSRVPVEVLNSYLHLSATQSTEISKIQDNARSQMMALRPQQGAQPDPSIFQKFQQMGEQTKSEIEGKLTAAQKAKVPAMLKELNAARSARIPMEVVPKLHLSSTQVAQLEALRPQGRGPGGGGQGGSPNMTPDQRRAAFQQQRQQALAVLTPAQKSQVDAYEAAHPRPQGGRGGFGGGGGFGRGGGGGAPGGGGA